MPRNSAGNYTLPAGNPVTGGTTIAASWANPTMSDLGNEIQNSLDRNGRGGMLVPFQNVDGTVLEPGITFTNEPGSGIYRAGSNDIRFSVGGEDTFRVIDDTATPAGERRPAEFWNGLEWVPAGAYDSTNVDITGGTIDGVAITGGSIDNVADPTDASGVGDRGFNDARYLLESNNLSDLDSASTARTNLDVAQQQSSVTDTTAGRGMIVGAAGFAGTAITDNGTELLDLDSPTMGMNVTAVYQTTASTANSPLSTNGVVLHLGRGARPSQQWWGYSVNRKFSRHFGGSGWSDWFEDLSSQNVQSSATDTTAGALMAVGAFGLGVNNATIPGAGADLDNAKTSGFYISGSGTANAPSSFGIVLVYPRTTDRVAQIFMEGSSSATYNKFYHRVETGSGWGPWHQHAVLDQAQTWTGNQTFDGAALNMGDNDAINFGDSSDMEIRHSGSSGIIDINTGNLFIQDNANENMFRFTQAGQLDCDGDVVAFSTAVGSDIRYKEKIRPVPSEDAQRIMDAFKGKRYHNKKLNREDSGVIAQQVPDGAQHLVTEQRDLNGNQPRLHFNYNGLWAYMIEARKQDNLDHKARADALQAQVNTLEQRLATLEAKLQ